MTQNSDETSLAASLAELLGEDRIVREPAEIALLSRDMGTPPPLFEQLLDGSVPQVAVQPRSTAELARAVSHLVAQGIPFTARGLGSTGLGGSVSVGGGAILDLSRLEGVRAVDPQGETVTVGAGTTFFFIQQELDRHGLVLRSHPTNAFGTVGGWASAGGLGMGSLEAGPFCGQVEQIEVVLPDGSVQRLGPEDEGFGDFFDTEGQLGLIAELRVRVEQATPRQIRGFRFADLEKAAAAAAELSSSETPPRTVLLASHHEEGHDSDEIDMLVEAARGGLPTADLPGTPLSDEATARLWQQRCFPMDSPLGPVFLASEAVLAARLVPAFAAAAKRVARRYGVPLHVHAHAVPPEDTDPSEPLLLVLLFFPCDPAEGTRHLMLTPLAAVLTQLARRHRGRPYGVGLWNTPFAGDCLGPERFNRLKKRKAETDPRGLLNPGKMFQLGTGARALPTLMNPAFYPGLLSLAATFTPMLVGEPSPRAQTTAERCISCGACVPVCPAVAATGVESVSGRAKLALMLRLARGEKVPEAELLGSLRCLECGQCGEVCARGLDLLGAWKELEEEVRRRVTEEGAVDEVFRTFANQVDASREEVMKVALP